MNIYYSEEVEYVVKGTDLFFPKFGSRCLLRDSAYIILLYKNSCFDNLNTWLKSKRKLNTETVTSPSPSVYLLLSHF